MTIRFRRQHTLGLPAMRKLVKAWVRELEQRYGLQSFVVKGRSADVIKFSRAGVDGEVVVAADHVEVSAQFGFLFAAFGQTIGAEIEKNLDAFMAEAGRAAATGAAVGVVAASPTSAAAASSAASDASATAGANATRHAKAADAGPAASDATAVRRASAPRRASAATGSSTARSTNAAGGAASPGAPADVTPARPPRSRPRKA